MSIYTITPAEVEANNVKNAPDILEGDPEANKNIFDKLPELITTKHNDLGDALERHEENTDNPHEVTAKQTGALVQDDILPGDNIIVAKNADGSVTINSTGGGGGGGGDMYRSVYDTNSDGVVNAADHATTADDATNADHATTAGTAINSSFASISNFSTSGAVIFAQQANKLLIEDGATPGAPPISTGRFRAINGSTFASFEVTTSDSPKEYSVVNANETEIELIVGRWYNFILDDALNTINFNSNKSPEPDVYSTTETLTNKIWIDGKPIYRRVFVLTNQNGVSATYIDTLVSVVGVQTSASGSQIPVTSAADSAAAGATLMFYLSGTGYLLFNGEYEFAKFNGIVEYTKN